MTFKFNPAEYAEMPSHLIRRDISSQVERMIDYLDSLEPDADLEPSIHGDDREPDLADDFSGTALEFDDSDNEPDTDDEESLGWTISHGACTARSYIAVPAAWCDLEGDEHDGREPEHDECSLGWTNRVNQDCPDWHGAGSADWSAPPNTDLELGDDTGIADYSGLMEQHSRTMECVA
ncbi:hypothetical protein N5K21_20560 [Rhizobium pusense]|uniref:hypothetical protein n=1 Tax=Agrobacterium pusense TaxID=648995 RepID=UPI00244800D2|nr:hypothetical protein [Agrobacterium pusense]MDH2091128.1 hypothetical protein [Agrobacterium pusense]